MMNHVVAVINQKGGVGKTTSTINLSCAFANSGQKTLIIDLDPQGNASTGVGVENNQRENSVYKLLTERNNWQHYVKQTKIGNLDIICANVELSGFETEVAENKDRAFILKGVLEEIRLKNQLIYKKSGNVITNNITNNGVINNITIVAFGKEEKYKISEKDILNAVSKGFNTAEQLTKTIHFNNKYPEYRFV